MLSPCPPGSNVVLVRDMPLTNHNTQIQLTNQSTRLCKSAQQVLLKKVSGIWTADPESLTSFFVMSQWTTVIQLDWKQVSYRGQQIDLLNLCLFPFLPLSPLIKVDHKFDTKPVWSEHYTATPTNPDNYSSGLTSLPVWPSASGLKPHCVSTVSSLQHIHHGWTEHCGGNKRDKQAAVLSTTARHP